MNFKSKKLKIMEQVILNCNEEKIIFKCTDHIIFEILLYVNNQTFVYNINYIPGKCLKVISNSNLSRNIFYIIKKEQNIYILNVSNDIINIKYKIFKKGDVYEKLLELEKIIQDQQKIINSLTNSL